MKKGDSCALFLEELKDILSDIGTLRSTILEAYIEDERANYARTWYVFNTSLAKDYLVFLGVYLAKLADRNEGQTTFELFAAGEDVQDSYDYLQDAVYLHEHVLKGINTTLLAYKDVVEKDRVVEVLVADLKKHLKLMEENLKQIQCV